MMSLKLASIRDDRRGARPGCNAGRKAIQARGLDCVDLDFHHADLFLAGSEAEVEHEVDIIRRRATIQ